LVTGKEAGPTGPGAVTIGPDGLALIAAGTATDGLDVVHCSNLVCSSGTEATPGNSGGGEIAIGGDGLPVLDYSSGTSVKVAHCSDPACSSTTTATVYANGYYVPHSSFTIGADGLPLIAYLDPSYNNLIVAHCSNVFCIPYVRRR